MEPFTLILWIWMGQRLEQTEIPNLTRQECVAQWLRVGSDRELVRTQCIATSGSNGANPASVANKCADCGQLPKPKSMVICPFAPPCWRDGKPIRGAL